MDVENVIDEMLDDLTAVNDEFINSYFNEEFDKTIEQKSKDEIVEINEEPNEIIENNNEQKNISERTINEDEPVEEKIKTFSYNEILDRLDRKEKIDINNPNDILNLIENSSSPEEFFDELEKVISNDK